MPVMFQVQIIPTALVKLYIDGKSVGLHRAMGDTGAQINLVQRNIVKHYESLMTNWRGNLVGIGDTNVQVKRQIRVAIRPWFDDSGDKEVELSLIVLPRASKWNAIFPSENVPRDAIEKPINGPMADPFYWRSSSVPILLGIEVWAAIVEGMSFKVGERLTCQESLLGNLILGSAGNSCKETDTVNVRKRSVYAINYQELDKTMQRFWEFEDLPLCTKRDAEDDLADKIFHEHHYREPSGRHVVAIPMKPSVHEIGDSRDIALRRFLLQEKKFERDRQYKEKYVEFMQEMIDLEHMVEAIDKPKEGEMVYYIPHHGVCTSNKFRVVLDASCKTKLGISLNGAQFVGGKLQTDLSVTIMRFRRHKIAINADIKKMFRQIRLVPEQWDLQRIFWRANSNERLREYHLVTVIYGQASSPYLAVKCMLEGAAEMKEEFPKAVEIIRNDFYMDDCASGARNESEAIQLAKDVKYILEKSCFDLCKWRSNSNRLVQELNGDDATAVSFNEDEQTSILGLKWLPKTDQFTFEVKEDDVNEQSKLTKRFILSKISQLFDPNGFVSPVIVSTKILMQAIWRAKIDWDDEVPTDIANRWLRLWSCIRSVEQVRIPRWLSMSDEVQMQLHGFADSSIEAYGCVIYLRTVDKYGNISCNLIVSKSKVAPLKRVTIPRLELAAAELLSTVISVVRSSMQLEEIPYYLWSDNTTALQWINKPLHELKLYVANRVKKIQESTNVSNWRHIRTAENPADLVSRGLLATEIVGNKLWWNGPTWLLKEQRHWPPPLDIHALEMSSDAQTELKSCQVLAIQVTKNELEIFVRNYSTKVPLIEYSRNLGETTRILVYVMRFVEIMKSKSKEKPKSILTAAQLEKGKLKHLIEYPSVEEKSIALKYFIRQEQAKRYAKEYQFLKELKEQNKTGNCVNSKLLNMRPFLDTDNIMRANTRLKEADIPYDAKYPIIIPNKSALSRLLISHAHKETEHGATQVMLQYLRNMYWLHDLRREIKSCILKCAQCVRNAKESGEQLMSELPADRVTRNRAFLHTGVDYAGPFEYSEHYKSRAVKRKCWIAIFVCMVTRAVHIDLVTDASSAAFIACFDRFVSRRGHCNKLYSDNGTAFAGAYPEIKSAFVKWSAPETIEHMNKKSTKWVFMKPAASHQGGIYEAAVKSAKHHIKRVIGAKSYSYDYFMTFLCKVEAILNSRPLYAPTDDPCDALVITPAHFLIGEPFILPPPISVPKNSDYSLQRIRNEQQQMLESWWKSWHNDYLSTLLPRRKWMSERDNFQIGQTVLMIDENLPPGKWMMAKVCELLPSKDGLVRNVVIEIAKRNKPCQGQKHGKRKQFTRPIQKLCILPAEPPETLQCAETQREVVS